MLGKKLAPKHQRLILQCYPGGRGVDKRPNASELSYLLYYVSTRRAKLAKVGGFLEKIGKHYVSHNRFGDVQVTLDILKSIIEKCPEDLDLYGVNSMTIMLNALNSNDLSQSQHVAEVFDTFCAAHDKRKAFNFDKTYTESFYALTKRLIEIGSEKHSTNELEWQQISINSCKSVASSNALNSKAGLAQGESLFQLNLVISLLVRTVYGSRENSGSKRVDHLMQLGRDIDVHSKNDDLRLSDLSESDRPNATESEKKAASDGPTDVTSARDVQITALKTLKSLVGNLSSLRGTIQAVTLYVIHEKYDPAWCRALLFQLTKWTQVNIRYYFILTLVSLLTDNLKSEPEGQVDLCYYLQSILSSSVSMIGLSIIDVMRVLLSHQHSIIDSSNLSLTRLPLHESQAENGKLRNSKEKANIDLILVTAIRGVIASLGTHVYYADQLCDMIAEILGHLCAKAGSALLFNDLTETATTYSNTSVSHQANEDRKLGNVSSSVAINDLQVIKDILHTASATKSDEVRVLRVNEWEASFGLLSHSDAEVGLAYISTFIYYLKCASSKLDKEQAKDLSSDFTGLQVLKSFSAEAAASAFDHSYDAGYLVGLNHLFADIVEAYGVNGAAAVIPACYALYEHAIMKNNNIICSLAINSLYEASMIINAAPLNNYISDVIKARRSNNTQYDIFDNVMKTPFDEDIREARQSTLSLEKDNAIKGSDDPAKNIVLSKEQITECLDGIDLILAALHDSHPIVLMNGDRDVSSGLLRKLDDQNIPRNSSPSIEISKTKSLNQLRIPSHATGYASTINSNHSSAHYNPAAFLERDASSRSKSVKSNATHIPKINDLKRVASSRFTGHTSTHLTPSRSMASFASGSVSHNAKEIRPEVPLIPEVNLSSFLTNLKISDDAQRGRVA